MAIRISQKLDLMCLGLASSIYRTFGLKVTQKIPKSVNQGSSDRFHRGQNAANLGVSEHTVFQNLRIDHFQNMKQHAYA